MQPIKSVLPFCSALPIQYTDKAINSFAVIVQFGLLYARFDNDANELLRK